MPGQDELPAERGRAQGALRARKEINKCVCIYIYIHTHIHMYVCICVYIYIEREMNTYTTSVSNRNALGARPRPPREGSFGKTPSSEKLQSSVQNSDTEFSDR